MTQFDFVTFLEMLDQIPDEVWVFDNNYNILYANNAIGNHNAFTAAEVIGKNVFEKGMYQDWYPGLLPTVYAKKSTVVTKQYSDIGIELHTIAVPIFIDGQLQYVVSICRETELINSPQQIDLDPAEGSVIAQPTSDLLGVKDIPHILRLIRSLCDSNSTVLFFGEPGVGKSALAKHMHAISSRKNEPFIIIDCQQMAEHNHLFTALGDEPCLLENAEGGMILFRNIDELDYENQEKLSMFLHDKTLLLNNEKRQKFDVKILLTTNKDLLKLVEAGLFHGNLYQKISTFEIYVPSLEDRKNDTKELLLYYLNYYNKQYNKSIRLTNDSLDTLVDYKYHTNVQELKEIVERIVVQAKENTVTMKHLPTHIFQVSTQESPSNNFDGINIDYNKDSLDSLLEKHEKQIIVDAYKRFRTSRKIAEKLGISQTKAARLMRKYL